MTSLEVEMMHDIGDKEGEGIGEGEGVGEGVGEGEGVGDGDGGRRRGSGRW